MMKLILIGETDGGRGKLENRDEMGMVRDVIAKMNFSQ